MWQKLNAILINKKRFLFEFEIIVLGSITYLASIWWKQQYSC